MLAGRLPFQGDTVPATMLAITSDTPKPIVGVRSDVPEPLARLVHRAMEKDVGRRTITAGDIKTELDQLLVTGPAGAIAAPAPAQSAWRRWGAFAAVAIVAAGVPGTWLVWQGERSRWAREEALPEIERLAEREDYVVAFRVANEARRIIPSDPVWSRIDPIVSRTVTVQVRPEGASVAYRPVGSNGDWTQLGMSPVVGAVVPNGHLDWRFAHPGFETATDTTLLGASATLLVTLHTAAETPPGMVHVTGGEEPRIALIAGLDHLAPQRLRAEDATQMPMFQLFGTPQLDKRRVTYDTAQYPAARSDSRIAGLAGQVLGPAWAVTEA
jgi:hypothetical protein